MRQYTTTSSCDLGPARPRTGFEFITKVPFGATDWPRDTCRPGMCPPRRAPSEIVGHAREFTTLFAGDRTSMRFYAPI
jgi:hypothetical protein